MPAKKNANKSIFVSSKLREKWGELLDEPPGWKELERGIQDAFRESRTAHFAGRTDAIAEMSAFCTGDSAGPQLLMVQGEAGSGKSGLMCRVMDEIEKRKLDGKCLLRYITGLLCRKLEDKCLLLPFCCGLSSRSSSVENMLRYFIGLLCEKLSVADASDDITKFQDLKDRFMELLNAACEKTRVVAVVDALDQLAGSDEAKRMLWISGKLPDNFRLLCSIIDGPETDAIKQLGGELRPVPPISKEDEAAIIRGIAKRQHKQIDDAVIEYILQKQTPDSREAAQNPLYLGLITQDLVMMDRYELDAVQKLMEDGISQPEALAKFMRQRIDETPGDPEGAYLAILARLEKLIGRDFVRGVCGMIAVSRGGLREDDMKSAFGALEMAFNHADLSWLRQMLRGHIVQGDMQQWDFAHQSLRRALWKDRPEELKKLNKYVVGKLYLLASDDYFAAREIMHHLCVGDFPGLVPLLLADEDAEYMELQVRGLADTYTEHEEGAAFLLAIPNSAENVKSHLRLAETYRCDILPLLPGDTHHFRIELMLAVIAMLERHEGDYAQRMAAAAIAMETVADLYAEIGQTEDAEAYYQKSLAAIEQKHGQAEEAGAHYSKPLDATEQVYEQAGSYRNLDALMSNKKNANKSIFVSSTFRDMQSERDALRDYTLSIVNEFASKYGRAVELIDLRWGVDTANTTEAEQNNKVLRTCLDEIERSRPFFIGLIGDRYGWTPPRTDMDAALSAARFPLDDLDMSVTALEIEYGVLRSPEPPISLFYFRESPDYSGFPDDIRQVYQDGEDGLTKLARLKEEILARFGTDVKSYNAGMEDGALTVSKEWARMIAEDIIGKLREEWGERPITPPDWWEQEYDIQEAFRESRTAHFAGRTAAIAEMAAFCTGDTAGPQMLMVKGEAGSGKSGLMCRVMDEIERCESDGKCLLLPLSCGLSSRSSTAEGMLRYFIGLLCGKLSMADDSDDITKFQDLKDRFMELLNAACEETRVVAVVDALDQLTGSDEARRMLWISGKLPDNFRLLCSIIGGPETDAIKQFGGEVRPVPLIAKEDEAAIIRGIAERHRKQIGDMVVEHILNKQTPDGREAAQNPLYLSLITQDLVMMDRYELDIVQKLMDKGDDDGKKMSQPEALAKFMRERIDETPGDPEGAYLAILARLEKLIGREFVRGVCGMIAVSRGGLRENDLDGAFKELEMDFNPADFSWLRQMLRGHMAQGDMQQWDFAHQSLRRALWKDRPEELKKLNDGIFNRFLKALPDDALTVREIMHHLYVADRPDLAAEVLAEHYGHYDTILARGLADTYTEHENGAAFLMAVPDSTENVNNHWSIAETYRCELLPLLPGDTHHFRTELMLAIIAMLERHEGNYTQRMTAVAIGTVAALYTETGQTAKASEYYQKALNEFIQIYEQTEGFDRGALEDLSTSYTKMGNHLTSLGQIEEAGIYYQKSLDACEHIYEQVSSWRKLDALMSLATSRDKMANHLRSLGRMEEAGAYYQKSLIAKEQIYEQTGTTDALRNLSVSYNLMGDHSKSIGKTEEAEVYYKLSLDADMRVYEQTGTVKALDDLSASYRNMGDHLISLGQMEEAGTYYRRSLDSAMQVYEQTGTIEALYGLSVLYRSIGDYHMRLGQTEEAGAYYQKSCDASEQIYDQSGTMDALSGQAMSHLKMGGYLMSQEQMEEAGVYCRKSLDAFEQIYASTSTVAALQGLSVSYDIMGDHLISQGQTEEAGSYYQKCLDTATQLYEQMGTADALRVLSASYNKMGGHLTSLGRTEEAGEYYQKSLDADEQIYEQTGTTDALRDLSVSYNKMGGHLTSLGQVEEAGEYYQKALDADEQIYEQTDTPDALRNLHIAHAELGDNKHALGHFDEANVHYSKAYELFKQCVKLDPSAAEYEQYYREKAERGET